ncbi:site-2 protease family protein [Gemmatimonadota bacterium]
MRFLLYLPVLLFSVVVHEVAHALVAKWEGDDTAHRLGRITLNPIPHLDLMGSVLVPLALYLLPGSFLFGWAKPVPVDPRNYRNFKWGDIKVSLAGIAANLILAFLCTVLLGIMVKVGVLLGSTSGPVLVLQEMVSFGIVINLVLAVFNLIPLPPLDGSHVAYHLLPPQLGARYQRLGRYGLGIVMMVVFFFPQVFDLLFWPVDFLLSAAEHFVGLWI